MRTYSRIFRIMHWSIAFCMVFLLVTIFLRTQWMEKNHVAAILNKNLLALDITLSKDQLIAIAKQIRKPMWNWHIYIGYVLIGLYAIRMALPFFGEMKFVKPVQRMKTNEKIQYWTYLLFYGAVGISLVTGFLIENGPREWKGTLETIHKLGLYYLLPFIFLHFTGLLLAEKGKDKGIISRMFRNG